MATFPLYNKKLSFQDRGHSQETNVTSISIVLFDCGKKAWYKVENELISKNMIKRFP